VSASAFVVVMRVELHFPDAGSLKGKRRELSPVKTQLHDRFGAAVAEVDHQDLWQRATLLAALTGSSAARLDAAVDDVQRWLDARFPHGAVVDRALLSLADVLEFSHGAGEAD